MSEEDKYAETCDAMPCDSAVVTEVDGDRLCADHAHASARIQARVDYFNNDRYAPEQFTGEFRKTYDAVFGAYPYAERIYGVRSGIDNKHMSREYEIESHIRARFIALGVLVAILAALIGITLAVCMNCIWGE